MQRADRADEGALDADGAPDAGSARVQMSDRAAGGALGADGAQDSGADQVRRLTGLQEGLSELTA